MLQSWIERTRTTTQPFETVAEKYSSNDVSTILLTDEKIFTMVTPNNPKSHQLYATAATKKKDVTTKRLRIRSTFRQSLMASVGESQDLVVEKTPVWYLSITESRLLRDAIVAWCCYNCSCPPYAISQASFSSFSRTMICPHGAWALNFLTDNFARYRLILKKNPFKADSAVNF